MKATNTIFIFCLLVVGFSNCKKPKQDPETVCTSANTAYIPTDARSRFFFKEGSWWIYKNITSQALDTLVARDLFYQIATPNKKMYGDKYAHKCYEYFEYKIFSQLYGWNRITVQTMMPIIQKDKSNEAFVYIDDYMPSGETILSVPRFFFKGDIQIDSLSNGIIEKQDSIHINNTTCLDVLHYRYKPGYEASDYLMEAWYANKIGMVKMKRKDGSIWELIDYKVNQ